MVILLATQSLFLMQALFYNHIQISNKEYKIKWNSMSEMPSIL